VPKVKDYASSNPNAPTPFDLFNNSYWHAYGPYAGGRGGDPTSALKNGYSSSSTGDYNHSHISSDLGRCEDNECVSLLIADYYNEQGYPLETITIDPSKRNPLGNKLDFVIDSIVIQMMDGVSVRFLRELGMDTGYPYNYERTFLNALAENHSNEYQDAVNATDWFNKAAAPTADFILGRGNMPTIMKEISAWVHKTHHVAHLKRFKSHSLNGVCRTA